jgi:small subunit ribosomal protein S13
MVRIANISLPQKKRMEIALTYIYGIGLSISREICKACNVDVNTKTDDLTDEKAASIRSFIEENLLIGDDLRRARRARMDKLLSIRCYRSLRHRRGLPANGQRTKNNAKTAKRRKNN